MGKYAWVNYHCCLRLCSLCGSDVGYYLPLDYETRHPYPGENLNSSFVIQILPWKMARPEVPIRTRLTRTPPARCTLGSPIDLCYKLPAFEGSRFLSNCLASYKRSHLPAAGHASVTVRAGGPISVAMWDAVRASLLHKVGWLVDLIIRQRNVSADWVCYHDDYGAISRWQR